MCEDELRSRPCMAFSTKSVHFPEEKEISRKHNASTFNCDRICIEYIEAGAMCDFEEFLFECGHGIVRFKSNCHFRRNDPNKECYSVKVLRNSWKQDGQVCESCLQQGVRFDPRTRKLYQEALIHG